MTRRSEPGSSIGGGNGSRRFCPDYMYGDIRGMFIGGLAAENPGGKTLHYGNTRYYFCNVYAANKSLSYMELLENTVCEAN